MAEDLTLKLAFIVVLGVAAQWAASRFRIPAILPLLVAGLIVGPGTGYIDPDAMFGDLLVPVVSLSVAIILFEGGLTLKLRELPQIGYVVPGLVTVGILVTFVIGASAAWLLFDMDAQVAFTLGAMLTVTGPTVIGPILDHIRPTGSVRPILKWEGIISDPIGALFTVLVFQAVAQPGEDAPVVDALAAVGLTVVVGVGLGLLGAAIVVAVLRRYWAPDYLHVPIALMALLAAHALANETQAEAGLFAATIMGVALANQTVAPVTHIVAFKENLRVLLIAALFIVLSARLERDDVTAVGFEGLIFLAALIVIARPAAVWLSSLRSSLELRERVFLAAMAPRGIVAAAVSSVIALRLVEEDFRGAELVVPVAFTVIIGTIMIYGLAATPLSRRLGLSDPDPQGLFVVGAQPWSRALAKLLNEQHVRILLIDSDWRSATDAREEGLECVHGSALAHGLTEDLDLSGIGRLLALTSNDGVNALACQQFMPIFGRRNVYQLNSPERRPGVREDIAAEVRGRPLFGEDVTYDRLEQAYGEGAVFKATRLSEEFDFEAYRAMYDELCLPLFTMNRHGKLSVRAPGAGPPAEGDVVISLVREPATEPETGALREEATPGS